MIVRELITRLGFSLDKAKLDSANKGIDKVKDGAERAASALRNIALSLASFATFKAIISVGDEMQSLRARIGLLPQTIGDVGDALDLIADRATLARTSITAYGQLYVRLAGATSDFISSQEDVLKITDAISQTLIIGGATASEAESATLQLSQAFQKGKLDGDEFRTFMETLSSDFKDKLAKELGTTKDKFFDLSKSGQLTTKKLAFAFQRMAPEISAQMLKMPLTIGQAFIIVTNKFKIMIDRMNRESLFVTKIADFILASFTKIENGIDKLVKAFGGWYNMIRFVGIAIGVAFGAKAISILMAFRTVAWTAALPFLKTAAIIALVALALEDLYVWIQGGDSLIGGMVGKWEDVKYTLLGVASSIAFVAAMITVWKTAVIGYTAALKAYEAAIIAVTAVKRGLIIVAAMLNLVLGLNPITLIVLAIGALIAAGVLLIANWKNVKEWFAGLFSWFYEKFTELGKWVAGLFGESFKIEGANNFVNAKPGATGVNAFSAVTPGQMAPSSMGASRPNINNNTQVDVTVPAGTTAEQVAFLKNAAKATFSQMADDRLSRDFAVYAP